MKTKVQPIQVVDQSLGKLTYEAFENQLNLCCLARLEIENRQLGAYILNKGDLDNEAQFQIVFAFALKGIHEQLTASEIEGTSAALQEAMKFLLPGEKCTFMLGCYSDATDRQKYLSELVNNSTLDLPSILIQNEQARVKELTETGWRRKWEQIIFCSWTPANGSTSKIADPLSKLIHNCGQFTKFFLDGLLGKISARQEQFLADLLRRAYLDGFRRWEMLLTNQAGLSVTALGERELWHWLWKRFNTSTPPPIPQLLILSQTDQQGQWRVREKQSTKLHGTTVLIQGEKGKSACPEHKGCTSRVYVRDKVCGVMVMAESVKGWTSLQHQLLSMWEVLAQPLVRDCEAWVELSPANKFWMEDNLSRQAKQSQSAQERALLKGAGRDVGAEIKQEESFEAQKKLYKGASPINCAVVFLIYRDQPRDLDAACHLMGHLFGTAKVVRENNIASQIWLETLPITWSRLLHSSSLLSERRLTLDNETVAGVLPISCPRQLDALGVEFLTQKGGKSVCVDLFTQTQHTLITGMTGSGKSVLLWRFMLDAIARNIPVVGIDFPAADGESSFKTGIELLGEAGAYFDITTASSNIMEPPDLRKFDAAERHKRLNNWVDFLRQTLLAIVMGQVDSPHLAQRVDAILRRAISAYLADPEIIERYDLAFEHGWKSTQWQRIPVLKDLLRFCSIARLQINKPEPLDHQALNQIHSQIEALLTSPLGDAIGKPSSFSSEPMVKFYALTGLNNDYDAYIMALNANAACVRLALSHPKSLFVGDELSVLCRRDGFSQMLGTLCATARKDGLSLLLSAQDPDTLAQSSASAAIMQNISYRITGKITANAVFSFEKYLKYPREIISVNASEAFNPKAYDLYSCWLIEKAGRFWRTRFYPGKMTLASIANNQEERKTRAKILALYPDTVKGKIYGLKKFTDEYVFGLNQKQ